jgi:ADP-dependent NAD(P)H-hydrate dehydratase
MNQEPTLITPELLRRIRLPLPEEGGDKEERGRVLVVGGGRETPGAVVLAGTAALRAGAGKLQVATGASSAPLVASSLPEARVFALPETRAGKFSKAACGALGKHLGKAQCVCIGPGMIEDESVARFVEGTLRLCRGRLLHALGGRAVVTPNADELEEIYGEAAAAEGALSAARRAADEFRSVVVMKGRETFVVEPGGAAFVNRAGGVGLATSGSGDVLAGIIAGLVARGAEAFHAAAWGVYLHALAGERLARKVGPLGFLARELPAEVPPLMAELSAE